jgi:hypothetical protein
MPEQKNFYKQHNGIKTALYQLRPNSQVIPHIWKYKRSGNGEISNTRLSKQITLPIAKVTIPQLPLKISSRT